MATHIMSSGSLSSKQIPGLTGLRGAAILMVLLLHFFLMAPESPTEHLIHTIMSMGWVGVDLFFVLSGALITGILLDSAGNPHYFRHFYWKRVLRILPLYYLLLILSFYVLPHVPFKELARFSTADVDPLYYWLFLSNFSIAALEGTPGAHHNIMDITWSLAIEEQFYLLWPLLVSRCTPRKLAWVSVGLILFSIVLRLVMQRMGFAPYTIYAITPTRLDGLAAGALIAIGLRTPGFTPARLRRIALILCWIGALSTGLVIYLSAGFPWDGQIVQAIGFTTIACLFSGLILFAYLENGSQSLFNRVISSHVLIGFGVLAFGIYLLHLPTRAFLVANVMAPESFAGWPGGRLVGQTVFMLISLMLVYAVGWISYHGYEKWFQRFRPRVETPSESFLIEPKEVITPNPTNVETGSESSSRPLPPLQAGSGTSTAKPTTSK